MQLSMFASTTPASSTSLVGTTIKLSRAGDNCCDNIVSLGSSKAMHAASMNCANCGKFRGWLSGEAAAFIIETRARFGAPETVTLRSALGAAGEGH